MNWLVSILEYEFQRQELYFALMFGQTQPYFHSAMYDGPVKQIPFHKIHI
jgi:hypothetical protein